ncbi:MAG: nucleotidyltransferase domain-containing protein, partial [Armatimonadota bacterium]
MPTHVVNLPTNLEVAGSRQRLVLLRHLAIHRQVFTGRELARAVGLDPKRASEALRLLVEAGMVYRQRAGRAYLYSINQNHYLISDALVPAFQVEQHWAESLGVEVEKVAGPSLVSVILYGSWARGVAGERSDIDLLVVVERRAQKKPVEDRLAEHYDRLADRFTRPVSFLVLSRLEFR